MDFQSFWTHGSQGNKNKANSPELRFFFWSEALFRRKPLQRLIGLCYNNQTLTACNERTSKVWKKHLLHNAVKIMRKIEDYYKNGGLSENKLS